MAKKKYETIAPDVRRKIYEELKPILITRSDGGYMYPAGMSDTTVAEKLGIETKQLRAIRTSMFGTFPKGTNNNNLPRYLEMVKRVEQLERTVALLTNMRQPASAPAYSTRPLAETLPRNGGIEIPIGR